MWQSIYSNWYTISKEASNVQYLRLTFQDCVHGTPIQGVSKIMDRWHKEDFLGPFWEEIHDKFGICRNTLHGFIKRFSWEHKTPYITGLVCHYTWLNNIIIGLTIFMIQTWYIDLKSVRHPCTSLTCGGYQWTQKCADRVAKIML